jgi:hypothetical protein
MLDVPSCSILSVFSMLIERLDSRRSSRADADSMRPWRMCFRHACRSKEAASTTLVGAGRVGSYFEF